MNEQIPLDLQPQPSYRLIPLTKGQFAKVDPEDYDWLMQWKWWACWVPHGNCLYAYRTDWNGGKSRKISMSRTITNATKGIEVDHCNHDTLDNRRMNLRLATRAQNTQNTRRRISNTSGHKGICWHKKNQTWFVRVNANKVLHNVGCFKDFDEAVAAYEKAAMALHGEFACLS